jgi:hypothetical protein
MASKDGIGYSAGQLEPFAETLMAIVQASLVAKKQS